MSHCPLAGRPVRTFADPAEPNWRATARLPLLLSLCLFVGGTSPAYAYLDPGTGTIIVQAIIGSAAAGAAVIGVYWQSARKFLSTRFRKAQSTNENVDERNR